MDPALGPGANVAETTSAKAARSKIVLRCADGIDNAVVAAELGVTDETVGKWRGRFVRARLDGLLDEPRSGAPRKITDDSRSARRHVVTRTISSTVVTPASTLSNPARRRVGIFLALRMSR